MSGHFRQTSGNVQKCPDLFRICFFCLITGCRRLKNITELDHPDIFFISNLTFFGNCLENFWKFLNIFGKFWDYSGDILGHFWSILEIFWSIFGTFLYSVEYFFYDFYTVYSTFSIIFQGLFFPIKKYFGPVIFFNRYIF